MKRLALTGLVLVVGLGAALAAGDAIVQRRALMKANGDATKIVVGMLKGAPFDLGAVQAALKTYGEAAAKAPALSPTTRRPGTPTRCPRSGTTRPISTRASPNWLRTSRRLERRSSMPAELSDANAGPAEELRRMPRAISRQEVLSEAGERLAFASTAIVSGAKT